MSGGRGSISLTFDRDAVAVDDDGALGDRELLARMLTSSSSEASSSMMAPRPSRSTWWIGMEVVPSTTVMSSGDLVECGHLVPCCVLRDAAGSVRSPRYGYEVVNARNELDCRASRAAGSAPAEWRVSDSPCSYEEAVAAMEARAAAIAAGTRAGAGLAARAPAALHRRHQRQAGRPARRALPGPRHRARRAVHLSRARPARRLRDARPQAPRPGRAPLRRDAGGMDHPHARRLRRARRAARGPHRRLGAPARQGRTARGQDRRHRHPREALGDAARHRAQRRTRTCRTSPASCPAASPKRATA